MPGLKCRECVWDLWLANGTLEGLSLNIKAFLCMLICHWHLTSLFDPGVREDDPASTCSHCQKFTFTFEAKKFYVAFYSQSKRPCFSGPHKTTGNIIIVVLVVMFRICKANGMVTALKMIITKRWLCYGMLYHVVCVRPGTLVTLYQPTWHNIPENIHLHDHHHENLKSQLIITSFSRILLIS